MSSVKNWIIIICLVGLAIYFWPQTKKPKEELPPPPLVKKVKPVPPQLEEKPVPVVVAREVPPIRTVTPPPPEIKSAKTEPKPGKPSLPFKIVNGLVVVQGDVVVGAPLPGTPPSGRVEIPPLEKWKGTTIPYHIQPDFPNPERVKQALAMFDGTAVRFVPHNNEADILVFERGEKNCLSYLGKMGGHQPLWLSPNCGPAEIAHEIMHALGFMHEQNRSDRDRYIRVFPENIEEDEIHNFEKLPKEFMNVSGLGPFDFSSVMIYAPWMFAKDGKSTMEPYDRDQLIQPTRGLSPGDIERINRAYGER